MVDAGILGEFGKSIWGILVHLGKSISWNHPQNTDSHPSTRPPSWGTRGSLGDTRTPKISMDIRDDPKNVKPKLKTLCNLLDCWWSVGGPSATCKSSEVNQRPFSTRFRWRSCHPCDILLVDLGSIRESSVAVLKKIWNVQGLWHVVRERDRGLGPHSKCHAHRFYNQVRLGCQLNTLL